MELDMQRLYYSGRCLKIKSLKIKILTTTVNLPKDMKASKISLNQFREKLHALRNFSMSRFLKPNNLMNDHLCKYMI